MPEPDFSLFTTWQTYVVALTVYLLTFATRLLVQYFWAGWKQSKFYNEIVLHTLPVAIGALIGAFASKFPWPEVLGGVLSARLMYGAILGLFCGFLYGRIRKLFGNGVPVTSNRVTPPASDDAVPPPPSA